MATDTLHFLSRSRFPHLENGVVLAASPAEDLDVVRGRPSLECCGAFGASARAGGQRMGLWNGQVPPPPRCGLCRASAVCDSMHLSTSLFPFPRSHNVVMTPLSQGIMRVRREREENLALSKCDPPFLSVWLLLSCTLLLSGRDLRLSLPKLIG